MKLLFFLFALYPISFILGQTVITGKIVQSNGNPIAGATVQIEGTYDGGVTDTSGVYQFETLETDTKNLIVKFVGFEKQIIPIDLSGSNLVFDVVLKEAFNELTAVNISVGAFEAGDKKKAVTLNAIDMITVPGAQGNVVGAMQYLPGTSTNGESGRLFVRGGNSQESQVYVDGTIVPVAYSPSAPNTAVRSKFNPFMFDGTIFSTGGFSAEFGQALSSVLLLNTKGIQEQDQLDISILSVGLGLAGTKKWKNGAVTGSFDHTNLAPYFSLLPQNIDWVKTPISNTGALNFRQKTKNGLFKLYGSYADSHFELNRHDLDNNNVLSKYNLRNQNIYTNASWTTGLGEKWLVKTGTAFTYNTDDIKLTGADYNETIYAGHIKTVFSRNLTTKIKLKLGGEAILNEYHQHYQTSEENIPLSFDDQTYASFAESNIYLSKNLVARIGGRFEYSSHLNRSNLSPRFSMAYKTGKSGQISAAFGQFYQAPEAGYQVYSDQLDFERADQYMLSYQWQKNDRTIRSELYYKSYNNLVKFTDVPFYLPSHYTNNGNGYAYGLDLFFRDNKTIRNGDYWISYSYLNTERDYLNFKHQAVPTFASKHNVSFIYKHWISKWRSLVGVSFNYASPRYYNDPNQEVFNASKMKAYQSLNLNWSFLFRENIIFYASASNVLGYQQEFGYEFASTPNAEGVYEKRLIEPPAPRFFIIGCFITLSESGDKNQLDKIQ